jgi:hypothetical protein
MLYTTWPVAETMGAARKATFARRVPRAVSVYGSKDGERGMIWLLAVAALAGAAAQEDDPQATVRELQQVYQDSCAQRAYGAFDDVCDQINQQLHQAQVAADRAAREARRKPPASAAPKPPAPAASPSPGPVTPPSAAPSTPPPADPHE